MEKSIRDGLVIAGSAAAGGWGGSWGTARVGALLGLRFGPWGAMVGTAIGALAGVVLAKRILENAEGLPELETQEE